MDISIDELLAGKATKIKDASYLTTADYVNPFFDRMARYTNDFRIKVELPKQITITETGEINTDDVTYNRVWLQAVLPDNYTFENHKEVIGMVYGLDVKAPICKLYRGALNMACTNPVVEIMEHTDTNAIWLNKLLNTTVNNNLEEVNELLGGWIRNSIYKYYDNGYNKIKIAASSVIDAYKSLFINDKSEYFVPEGLDTSMFNVYNAFTKVITNNLKKDMFNQVEKTLLVKQLIDLEEPSL